MKIDVETLDRIRYDYEHKHLSVYALAKKYGLSTSTVHKYKTEGNWEQQPYESMAATWKEAEKEAKQYLGDWIIGLAKLGAEAIKTVDPNDHQALTNLTRAAKNIADMVGAKTYLDEQEQKARIEALKKSLQKDTNAEPMKIEIQAPEEYLK